MTVLGNCLSLLLCLNFVSGVVAQKSNFTFQRVDGLSQNTVFNVTQDKQGFLWVATGDGLNRYDGRSFRAYKPSPENKPGYITGRVIRNKVVEGSNDNLWLSTESGLQSFDKKRNHFTLYVPFKDSLNYANGSLYPIFESSGVLWFGKSNAGILGLSIATKKFEIFPFPNDSTFNYYSDEDVAYDKSGNIWFSRDAGLYCFNSKKKSWQVYLPGIQLKEICIRGDQLFTFSAKGVVVFNILSKTFYTINQGSVAPAINTIALGPKNTVWLGDALGTVYQFDHSLKSILPVGNVNGNSGNIFPVYDLYFDASGILWIGTDGMGLLKANINPPDFYKFPADEKSKDLFIKSIYEDAGGTIWLGTFGHGIILLNRKEQAAKPLQVYPFSAADNKNSIVSFIREDLKQNLWVGYGHKIYVRMKNETAFKEVEIPAALKADRLQATGMLAFDNKVLITTTIGCFAFTEQENKIFVADQAKYSIGDFIFLYRKNKDQFITGYLEGGLHLYTLNANGTWAPVKQLLKNVGIKCLYNDVAGKLLWLGTDKGLIAYNPADDTYRIFAEQSGLNNSFIYGILESRGELWLSTNGGLSNIKLGKPHADSFPTIVCKNYRFKDGLQSDEFNTNAYLKGRDGTLYFGGIKGVNWFNPQTVTAKKKINHLAFVNFFVNDKPADTVASEFIRRVELPYNKNNIYLQFAGLEFSDPERINYAYMLHGWDKKPIRSNINEVRYNNLPPGDYVFKATASNDEIDNLNSNHEIFITIFPPYWRTWWFYCLLIITTMVLLWWAFTLNTSWRLKKERSKLLQQQEMYNERMRIAREMHDDIGAGLTQISLISASARSHAPAAHKTGTDLEAISNTARLLVDNLSEIIWALNPAYNKVDILLSHVREQVSKLTEYANIRCHIKIEEGIPNHTLSNQQRRNILLVTKEIVHNAIKHCGGENLTVHISYKKDQLNFHVEDDGKGFDTDETYAGNGLKNIRHRIEEIGGVLELESKADAGCCYRYSFPLS